MKKLVSLILALAMCLALGAPALAKSAAELPRPDAYLGDDCVFYDSEMYEPASGAEEFHHIQAAVEIDDADELVEYLYFLESGPFDLTMTYSEGLEDGRANKAAFFEYDGDADPGTIRAGDGLSVDGAAPVQAAIFMEEGDGMAVLVLLCADGFKLVKDWDDGEKPSSGGFNLKDFLGLGGPKADPLPDPRSALSANKKSLDIEQMDDETIDGVDYSVYSYSFTYSALSVDIAHSFYAGVVEEAGYTMDKGEDGDDRTAYTISDGDGNTAVLVEYKKPAMSFSSWWTLYVPEGMEFDYGGDASISGVAGGTITGGTFQNPIY